ncbi:MAG: putative motility protein [Lachnospiraceae bacterium]|nr:putative motility protein [Lachnospiraceae bacterium]
MNITSLSSTNISLSGTNKMDVIDISMLKKTLNSVEANGDMLTQMMEQSVNPFVGTNIDIKI